MRMSRYRALPCLYKVEINRSSKPFPAAETPFFQRKQRNVTFAAGNNFLSAYKSYGMNGIDSLVVEVNKEFNQLICSLAKVATELQEVGNIFPASSTDHKRKGAYALFKKRFKVALGCMAIRTQTGLSAN